VKVESEPAGGGGAVGASVWPLPPVGAAWGVPKNSVTALTCFFARSHEPAPVVVMTAFSRRGRDRLEAANVSDTVLGHRRAVPSHAPVVWGVERRLHLLVLHEAVVLRCHRPKQLDVRVRMLLTGVSVGSVHRGRRMHRHHARLGRRCVTGNRVGRVAAEYTLERRDLPGS
jgi:hypothetical protein